MVQVVDLGGDVRIFRGNTLGRRHQFRTHGAGQRDQDLQIRLFLDRLDRGPALFVQSLSRPGGVIESEDERGELMAAGDAVEGKARPAAVRPADPDAGQMIRIGGVAQFYG